MNKYQIEPMPGQVSAEVIELLGGVDTATIGHWRHYGFCDRKIQPLSGDAHVAGTAVTLAIPGADSTLLHHAVGLLRPGDILVIDRLGENRYACWGGGITIAVKASGATAGIVDGPVTDSKEIVEEGFPIWSTGLSSITTGLYDLGGRMNTPVSVGGVVVNPGDVVLADRSGVLIMPPHEAEEEARRALGAQSGGVALLQRVKSREIHLGMLTGATAKVEAGSGH